MAMIENWPKTKIPNINNNPHTALPEEILGKQPRILRRLFFKKLQKVTKHLIKGLHSTLKISEIGQTKFCIVKVIHRIPLVMINFKEINSIIAIAVTVYIRLKESKDLMNLFLRIY